jgi:hypothetical protein
MRARPSVGYLASRVGGADLGGDSGLERRIKTARPQYRLRQEARALAAFQRDKGQCIHSRHGKVVDGLVFRCTNCKEVVGLVELRPRKG